MTLSRIGKMPVKIPTGVKIEISPDKLIVNGSKGKLEVKRLPGIEIKEESGEIICTVLGESQKTKAFHGLSRALIANAVKGVTEGFQKSLELQGVGYRVQVKGKDLELNVGYSHPVVFKCPPEIEFSLDEKNKNIIYIKGIDRQKVGEIAANIRKVRKPEPYKGKGIRYLGEEVQIKAGKAAAKAS